LVEQTETLIILGDCKFYYRIVSPTRRSGLRV